MAQATKTKLTPLGDKVVVQPTQREETTKSGIVLPDTAKEKPQEGVVVAVGNGRVTDAGDRIKPEVKEGQKVRKGDVIAYLYTPHSRGDGCHIHFHLMIDGKLAATFVYPTGGKEAVETAAKILRGESVPHHITLATQEITK